MEGNNLTISFVSWWYGEAYSRVFKYIKAAYIYFTDAFSVLICFRTLFAPWKRDMISYEGLSLQQKFQVWTLNLASRFVGFLVKSFTLGAYLIFVVFLSCCSLAVIIIWILYPLLLALLIWRAIISL